MGRRERQRAHSSAARRQRSHSATARPRNDQPLASALYPGAVTHHRLRPKEHRLAYRIWSMLIDLDELDASRPFAAILLGRPLQPVLVLRARSRRPFGTRPQDAGRKAMRAGGVEPDGGPIRLLTMPRLLGYAFNPLSIYFCHRRERRGRRDPLGSRQHFRRAARLSAAGDQSGDGDEIRQRCGKDFYVSPFMDMDLAYEFRVRPPAELFSARHRSLGCCRGVMMTAPTQRPPGRGERRRAAAGCSSPCPSSRCASSPASIGRR